MFEKLKHTFAQDAPNEEQAYVELANKLMKLTDVLGDPQTCMDEQIKKKQAAAGSAQKASVPPVAVPV